MTSLCLLTTQPIPPREEMEPISQKQAGGKAINNIKLKPNFFFSPFLAGNKLVCFNQLHCMHHKAIFLLNIKLN